LKELPLWPGAKPCLRSGFCCKQGVCSFGEWNTEQNQCMYLGGEQPGEHYCKIFDLIVTSPGWEFSPAFGAGCCSSLNTDRLALLTRR
jgi:hypothetical protein